MEEAIKHSEAKLVVYIEPSKTAAISTAVKRELSSFLFKYNELFGGVLLAFDFVIQSKLARVLSLYPYIAVTLNSNLLLFAPQPRSYLEGKVVKIAPESIHVVVLGFSAAIITDENIRDEFKFKVKNGKEIFRSTSHKRHVIKLGTIVRFSVNSFDEETLHISGSLLPPATGSIRWLSKNSQEISLTARSFKKRAYNEGGKEELSTGTVDGGALSSDYHVLKKPKMQRLQQG